MRAPVDLLTKLRRRSGIGAVEDGGKNPVGAVLDNKSQQSKDAKSNATKNQCKNCGSNKQSFLRRAALEAC